MSKIGTNLAKGKARQSENEASHMGVLREMV